MRKLKALLLITVMLICVGCGKHDRDPLQGVWVFDTDQYPVFKQLTMLIANDDSRRAVPTEQPGKEQQEYRIYEIDDIKVRVDKINEFYDAKYTIYQNNVEIHNFTITRQGNPFGVTISYVDINRDNVNDVVVIGEAPNGTLTTPKWICAYDIKSDSEIDIFADSGELTESQIAQVNEFLDKNFNALFPDNTGVDCTAAEPYVDQFGNLYYRIGIYKDFYQSMGEMLILFSYNADTDSFDVSEVLYMPLYVEEEET